MARMFPLTLLDADVKSQAEHKVFDILRDQLSDEWDAFHSASLPSATPGKDAQDGEDHPRPSLPCSYPPDVRRTPTGMV